VQASDIAYKLSLITENAPRLIAVVGELTAVDNFKFYFPGGDVYFDPENGVKKAIGGGMVRLMSIKVLFSRKFWNAKSKLNKDHSNVKEGAFTSDGLNSGAVLVVSTDARLKYLFLEEVFKVCHMYFNICLHSILIYDIFFCFSVFSRIPINFSSSSSSFSQITWDKENVSFCLFFVWITIPYFSKTNDYIDT
jgi:hypothetical protein